MTVSSALESIYVTVLILACAHTGPPVFLQTFNRNVCLNHHTVLDARRICRWVAIPDSELLSGDRELLEEAGSTPPEFTQSQSTHEFCMSEIHLLVVKKQMAIQG